VSKADDYREMVHLSGWQQLAREMADRIEKLRGPVNRANTAKPDWHLEAARNLCHAQGIEKVFREVEETLEKVKKQEEE